MENPSGSWQDYWEARGSEAKLDYDADRRSSRDAELDEIAERELIAFIDPKIDDRILDAGCGTGVNLSRLSPRVDSLVGIDYSEQMIRRAGKRLSTEGIRNATVQVGSIARTALESNSFDKILCISVMQYLDDKDCRAAFREFVRLSKDGGTIILHVKNLASLYLFSLFAAKKLKSLISKNVKIEYLRTQRWYERALRELGAVPIQFDAKNIFVIDFLPHRMYEWLVRTERKHYKSGFLRRYGSEYFIKAKVEKRPGVG
jgi:ubiquinone/menaquinone biosynthesis C-methylase UbiE